MDMTERTVNVERVEDLIAVFGSFVLLFLRYPHSLLRLVTSIVDLAQSLGFYFAELFRIDHAITPGVTVVPDVDISQFLPFDLDELLRKLDILFPSLWVKEHFILYLKFCADLLYNVSIYIMLLLPIIIMLVKLVEMNLLKPMEETNGDSRAMARFRRYVYAPYFGAKLLVLDFIGYVREHIGYFKLFAFIWLVNLNIITIVVEFFAFYFYFATTFYFSDIPTQLLKLLIDVIMMFSGAPFVFWLVVGYIIFHLIRKAIGFRVLNFHESANVAFINAQPLGILITGTMGAKKTTTLVDMALTTDVEFRKKALDSLMKNDYKFPNFPWAEFRRVIKHAIRQGYIFNLVSCDAFMDNKYERFSESFSEKAYTEEELTYILTEAGFKVMALYNDYTEKPVDDTCERIVFVAQKIS